MRTPQNPFVLKLSNLNFKPDAGQLALIDALSQLYPKLLFNEKYAYFHSLRLRLHQFSQVNLTQGLYIYGGVGRGKTFIMDVFFHALPLNLKLRQHFYEFMAEVHRQLNLLSGQKLALKKVAKKISLQAKILCLDELFVQDIGDASILGPLFKYLFDYGVSLILTSNVAPDNLYRDGLNRSRFIPTIELIKTKLIIFPLLDFLDYRTQAKINEIRAFQTAPTKVDFFTKDFELICPKPNEISWQSTIILDERTLQVEAKSNTSVWIKFANLCKEAKGVRDYADLAKQYSLIFLSEVPIFDDNNVDQCRRFIMLIDTLYEHKTKLFIQSEFQLKELHQTQKLKFEFERTQSRLIEMQSKEYLQSEQTRSI